jgi:glutamyl-tRNA synthetase
VIRGEDLIDTTHRVLAIRHALGATEPPVYAHLPLILQADRSKLGKRHGAVAVEDFRERGFLAEALLNYLALLGWAPEDDREVMTRAEILAAFRLDRVNQSSAVFDDKKLEWMNGEWIRRLDLDDLIERLRPFVAEHAGPIDDEMLRAATVVGQERATTLVSLAEQMDFLAAGDQFSIPDSVWAEVAGVDRAGEVLDAVIGHVDTCAWDVDAIGELRGRIEALGLKPRKVMKVIYVAVEGRPAGLPLFDSMHLLGRDVTLARLRASRTRLA